MNMKLFRRLPIMVLVLSSNLIADVLWIGPGGKTSLFQIDKKNTISYTKCKSNKVVLESKDCVMKIGTVKLRIDEVKFKKILGYALVNEEFKSQIDKNLQKKVNIYNAVNALGLATNIQVNISYAEVYGVENSNQSILVAAKKATKDSSLEFFNTANIVKDIQSNIDELIANIKTAGINNDHTVKYSTSGGGKEELMYKLLEFIEKNPIYFIREKFVKYGFDTYIMKTPVTQLEYFTVTNSNPSYYSRVEDCPDTHVVMKKYDDLDRFKGMVNICPDRPVDQVTYDGAQRYLGGLQNKMNELKLANKLFSVVSVNQIHDPTWLERNEYSRLELKLPNSKRFENWVIFDPAEQGEDKMVRSMRSEHVRSVMLRDCKSYSFIGDDGRSYVRSTSAKFAYSIDNFGEDGAFTGSTGMTQTTHNESSSIGFRIETDEKTFNSLL